MPLELKGIPVRVRAGQDVDVRLLALAPRAIILVGGQINDSLCVAMVGPGHDGHMRRAGRSAVRDAQRQVIRLGARVDKVGNLRSACNPLQGMKLTKYATSSWAQRGARCAPSPVPRTLS